MTMSSAELPTQTVTFLFSDIEGSTKLLQSLGHGYIDLLQQHNRICREVIQQHGGAEIGTEGDSFFVVFPDAREAAQAAIEIQRALADQPPLEPVRVRMGLHTGQGRRAGGDYVGIDVHRAARIAAAGHGGQILISDSTRALVEPDPPGDVGLRDLGRHRLKDLIRPEHLFQLVATGLPSEFPAPRSLDARPNNLPVQLTRFIGREEVVSEVRHLLLNGARLLTLTGPGGTGKTRLALEVAAETLEAFEDGVWFVDLAPITDPALVIATIAEVLGVKDNPGRPPDDALEDSLRDRAILLVLDNFEHVVEAGAAVERLLRAAPPLKVLVTSRVVLHRYGEQEFPVLPLDLPDAQSARDPVSLMQCDAIRLFMERATAVKPDFVLTSDNAPWVAEIAVRLDGLPLAIELAASRVNILSPHAIVERLARGSPLLRSSVQDAPARQRTLRAAIEWSYQLLKEPERLLFDELSAFQGGASLEAVESVCSPAPGADTLDSLATLVDNSLLRQGEEEDAEPRFVMLETIKQYAAERLEQRPEVSAATRRAHATFYAAFARQHWRDLTGPTRESSLAAVAADIENLRLAWRYWVREQDLDQLNKLVDTLWLLYDARGWYHATIEVTTDLLGVLSSTPSTPERAMQEVMMRTSLARALMAIHGYTQEVEQEFARALVLFEGREALPQLFPVLRGLASFYNYRGEFDKGAQVGRDILRLAEAQGDPSMRVDGHLVLGSSIALGRDLRAGLDQLDQAIACFDSEGYRSPPFRLGNNPGVAAFTVSALVLWLLGFPDRSLERATRAVALGTRLEHPFTLCYAFFHSGFLHLWRGEPEPAFERATKVVDVADEFDVDIWKALGKCLIGASIASLGQVAQGLERFHEGLDLYHGLKTPPVFWPLLLMLQAGIYARSPRPADGVGLIDEAIELAGAGLTLVPEFYLVKGDLLLAAREVGSDAPEQWFQRAFDAAHGLGARMSELRAALRLCRLWFEEGKAEEGSRVLQPVYEGFTEGFGTADLREAGSLLGIVN
jgi:predicted ATPase/class 3 adenylate cyclase